MTQITPLSLLGCYQLCKPAFGQSTPFFVADPLRIPQIGWQASMSCQRRVSPQMFWPSHRRTVRDLSRATPLLSWLCGFSCCHDERWIISPVFDQVQLEEVSCGCIHPSLNSDLSHPSSGMDINPVTDRHTLCSVLVSSNQIIFFLMLSETSVKLHTGCYLSFTQSGFTKPHWWEVVLLPGFWSFVYKVLEMVLHLFLSTVLYWRSMENLLHRAIWPSLGIFSCIIRSLSLNVLHQIS